MNGKAWTPGRAPNLPYDTWKLASPNHLDPAICICGHEQDDHNDHGSGPCTVRFKRTGLCICSEFQQLEPEDEYEREFDAATEKWEKSRE